MAKCINIKHKDFIKLLEDSKLPSLVLEVKIAKWQEENNSDKFPSLSELSSDNQVNYQFKSVDKILQNFDKIKKWETQVQNPPVFWEKLQKDLGIPKEQVELLKQSEGNTIEDKLISFSTQMSYTIEINTAKQLRDNVYYSKSTNQYYRYTDELGYIGSKDGDKWNIFDIEKLPEDAEFDTLGRDSQYYSSLTVPGGTNYTENEIATPSITPSIKGHAQFSTDKGIGWFRSDDRQVNLGGAELSEEYAPDIEQLPNGKWEVSYMPITGGRKLEFFKTEQEAKDFVKSITKTSDEKTRRILEVQYIELFNQLKHYQIALTKVDNKAKLKQWLEENKNKWANGVVDKVNENITKEELKAKIDNFYSKFKGDTTLIKLFLGEYEQKDEITTFFIKSIIQDTAKQTITEVQEFDVEAKVRELEKEGLLEIDCKGLKAEKGLQTNFTKGGKWKVIKDLKGYPTHKEGGVDLTISKNGVSIKNGNTEFTAKHGLLIPKN